MRRIGVGATCALVCAACGSKPAKVDEGGFTAAQRTAAQTALGHLAQTALPRAIVAISYQTGVAPTTCVVVPGATSDAFQLVLAWKPNRPSYLSVPQSVIEATIGVASAKDDSYTVTSFGGGGGHPKPEPPRVEADLVRAEVARPAETCEALATGNLQLVPGS